MSHSNDPFAEPGGNGATRIGTPEAGWASEGGRAAFWIVASGAPLVLCVAWFWYGLSYFDEMTDNRPAGMESTSVDTGVLLGVPPLVLSYLVALFSLLLIGFKYHVQTVRVVVLSLAVVVVASVIGIAVNQLLWAGCLFAMSATSVCPASGP